MSELHHTNGRSARLERVLHDLLGEAPEFQAAAGVSFDGLPMASALPHGMDVRPHPHINLATVTYLFEGEIIHRDSLGVEQSIRPGAINWMTAGRGIVHSERSPKDRSQPLRLSNAGWRQGARTRSVSTWLISAHRLWATRPMVSTAG